jgi:CRP-like cAMP-binding protein
MKPFINFINSIKPIPKNSCTTLVSIVSIRKFSKGDNLVKVGEKSNEVYVLKSGLIRSFYTDDNGKEYINQIFVPFKTSGALGALLENKPSKYSYDCLSDCEVYAINFKKLKEFTQTDQYISQIYTSILEEAYLILESKIYDLSVLNATDRYLKLKQKISEIDNLIPQYHIASYLNITPVQLSRIRKEIYSK